MLQFFRNFFQSRIGIVVTLGFVGLIALAFAAGDIMGNGNFGGVGSHDVATVGKQKLGAAELSRSLANALERARQQNPGLTMRNLVDGDGVEPVLDSMIDRTAIAEFGRAHDLVAGKRLVDSELTKIPGLQGLDGKFSQATYRQLLAQRQLTDADVRGDLATGLIARQVMMPAQFGATVPAGLAARYASLLAERRIGSIGIVPSVAFAPKTPPTDGELAAWYAANKARFTRPERRVIRWATFGDSAVKSLPSPTEAEIAARYEADKAKYAASESRRLTQLVLPTEAAAKAVAAEVAGGAALSAAAKSKGLATATIGPVERAAYASQSSKAAADAVFTAARGALVGPVKGSLGWMLVRVESVEARPARTLQQVHGEITAALAADRRRAALTDLATRIEEQFDKSGALGDAARDLGVTVQSSPAMTADGRVFGSPGVAAPAAITPVIQAAFAMEAEQKPQLAEIEPGKTFMIFDVNRIEPAAAPPLAEVKGDVTAALLLEKGVAAAKAGALKALAAAKAGKDLPAALASLGVALPPPSPIAMTRQQLSASGRTPPPLALLFSMAQGTTKLLPAPRNAGWFVVQLKSIEPGQVPPGSPLLAETANEVSRLAGQEYVDALRLAIRAEVGVKRNDKAVKAVVSQVLGGQ